VESSHNRLWYPNYPQLCTESLHYFFWNKRRGA